MSDIEEIRSKIVKESKGRPCTWCDERIEPKTIKHTRLYKLDGDLFHEHLHLECEDALQDAILRADDDYWYEPGAMVRGKPKRKDEVRT